MKQKIDPGEILRKKIPLKVLLCFWVLCCSLPVLSQKTGNRIDINVQNASVRGVLEVLKKHDYQLAYPSAAIDACTKKVTLDMQKATPSQILDETLKGTDLVYKIDGMLITIREAGQSGPVTVRGVVKDDKGEPLPGVTIQIEGTTVGTITDTDGNYTITCPKRDGLVLLYSFIGMKTRREAVGNRTSVSVQLETENTEMEEVVITGIYQRKKESFTGSSQTYKAEDLKVIGNQNLIQSLKTLDPAFNIVENNEFGSDPNRLPDLEIRGKSSIVGLKEQFGEDPNQPLFILDGFETTLRTIMDLNMDRVASVTILKDAASTAIYGAKAANGVIVVETKAPEGGKLKLSYNGNFDVSFADLSAYNLMNAEEKLEFERRAGNFKSNVADFQEMKDVRYNKLLANVRRGVNTYWLSEPIHTGLNQRHNLYAEGGNEQFRYGMGVTWNKVEGVMKTSDRDVLSGNLDLLYRVGKLTFSNKLSVDATDYNNPVVPFSEYANANPYYPKRNADGSVEKWLEYQDTENNRHDASVNVGNPLWNAELNSYDKGDSFGVRNNFNLEYRPFSFLYVRGRFGIDKSVSKTEEFTSPENTMFDETELLKKGSYSNSRSDAFSWDGDLTVTYGQLLNDVHQLNAVLGMSVRESKSTYYGFEAVGFPEGDFTTPGFANQYPESGKPSYGDSKSRSANFYFNGGYSYDNRYLLDMNLRLDGSSVFGSNKQFTTTWAFGFAWNIHNERFLKDNLDIFDMLKLRTSVGNPGNQNFGSFNTITTYRYNNWMLNNFGPGLLVDAFGDPNLEWQKTIDWNIGFDLSMWSRLHVNFDWYRKNTDPLLASMGVPSSIGISSRLSNIGKQITEGFNGTLRYAVIYRPKDRINWTASLTFGRVTSYYDKIGNRLDQYNRENLTKNLTRYYNGGSPTALWTVRSGGIDPATGKEIFITKEGKNVFEYNYDDEVEVGDSAPDVEGVLGNVLYYKGFSFSIYLRYSLGADAFNNTLYSKVENISSTELAYNQDKRALYDRWQKPGDVAQFKSISLTDETPMSSRFVQKNNYLVLESIRLAYELPSGWLRKIRMQGMTVSAYMNDICRFSTIEVERGTSYPFARSVSMSLSINF